MNDETKTLQAGNITYTLSDGDTVLTPAKTAGEIVTTVTAARA